jgi:hypothetical protein
VIWWAGGIRKTFGLAVGLAIAQLGNYRGALGKALFLSGVSIYYEQCILHPDHLWSRIRQHVISSHLIDPGFSLGRPSCSP